MHTCVTPALPTFFTCVTNLLYVRYQPYKRITKTTRRLRRRICCLSPRRAQRTFTAISSLIRTVSSRVAWRAPTWPRCLPFRAGTRSTKSVWCHPLTSATHLTAIAKTGVTSFASSKRPTMTSSACTASTTRSRCRLSSRSTVCWHSRSPATTTATTTTARASATARARRARSRRLSFARIPWTMRQARPAHATLRQRAQRASKAVR